MNKVVTVVPVDAPPLALRFHPVLASTLAIAEQDGVVVFADTGSSAGSPGVPTPAEPHMQLGCGSQVTAFDICTTGDAFAVGDIDGHAHVHPEKDSDFCVCCCRSLWFSFGFLTLVHLTFGTVQLVLAGDLPARKTRAPRSGYQH